MSTTSLLQSSSSLGARGDDDQPYVDVLKLTQEFGTIDVRFLDQHQDDTHDKENDFDRGEGGEGEGGGDPLSSPSSVFLTEELLKAHNRNHAQESTNAMDLIENKHGGGGMERRQFNCPECPKRGRGKYVFFKNVPAYKPIVKCPQCKKASRGKSGGKGGGNVTRLYALPKVCEKGYGLFKCVECQETWGSSRAIGHIGQECYNCKTKTGKVVYVKPFRLEVVKNKIKNKGGILGGGPGRRMRRVPKQSIGETEATDVGYTDDDRERNQSSAENALVLASKSDRNKVGGGGGGSVGGVGNGSAWERASMFIYLPPPTPPSKKEGEETVSSSTVPKTSPLIKVGIPPGYVHHCEGCASGLCKSRYLPKSLYHDESDGDTVSTRASVVTNSSIDKTDYIDRDEDFSFYEDVSEGWETVRRRRR